jgi:rod shape-determining protein MreC
MPRTFTLLVVLSLGHVLLISSQVQSQSGTPVLESVAFGTVAKVQGVSAGAATGVQSIWRRYFALQGVERENEALRQRVLELEGRLQTEEARASRTRQLEEALKLQQEIESSTLAARVIAGSPAAGEHWITIDRGALDGVGPDMAVMAGRGVIGRVIGTPTSHAAKVQLLIARNAAAGAMLEKSRAGAIVLGGADDGLLALDMVQGSVTIDVGEQVFTSGQDGIYPQGFVIGKVDRVEGAGKTRRIVVRPAVDFTHIEVVLVLLTRPPVGGPGDQPGAVPQGRQ